MAISGAAGAIISAVTSAVSAAVSIGLSAANAKNQRETARYNAALKRNQATAIENAEVTKRGDLRAAQARQIAAQSTAISAKGLSLDSETSLSIFSDTEYNTDIEIERSKYNAEQKANALRSGAEIGLAEGYNAATNTIIGGIGDFAEGAGDTYRKFGEL